MGLNDRRSLALAAQGMELRDPASGDAPEDRAVSQSERNPYGRVHIPAQLSAKTLADLESSNVSLLNTAVPKLTRYFSEHNFSGLSSGILTRLLELVRLPQGEGAEILAQMAGSPARDVYGVPESLSPEVQLLNNVLNFWSTYSAYSPEDVMALLDMGLSYRIQQVAIFPGMPLQIVRSSMLALGNLVGDTLETRLRCFKFGVMDVYMDLMRRCKVLGDAVVSDLTWALINVVRPLKDGITSGMEYLQVYPEILRCVVDYLQAQIHKKISYYTCWGLYYVSCNPQLFGLIPLETVVSLCLIVVQECDDALTPAMRLLAKEVLLHEREPQVLRNLLDTFSSRPMVEELACLIGSQCRLVRVAILEFIRNIVPFPEPRTSVIRSSLLSKILVSCTSNVPDLMEVALDTLGGILTGCTDAEFSYVCDKKLVHILAKVLGGTVWKNMSPASQSSLSKQVYYALTILDMILEFGGNLSDTTRHELLTEDLENGISDVCTSIPTIEALAEKVVEHLASYQMRTRRELVAGQNNNQDWSAAGL